MMNGPAALTLSLLMLGGLVLGIGGLVRSRKPGEVIPRACSRKRR